MNFLKPLERAKNLVGKFVIKRIDRLNNFPTVQMYCPTVLSATSIWSTFSKRRDVCLQIIITYKICQISLCKNIFRYLKFVCYSLQIMSDTALKNIFLICQQFFLETISTISKLNLIISMHNIGTNFFPHFCSFDIIAYRQVFKHNARSNEYSFKWIFYFRQYVSLFTLIAKG